VPCSQKLLPERRFREGISQALGWTLMRNFIADDGLAGIRTIIAKIAREPASPVVNYWCTGIQISKRQGRYLD
jgi:hypothetical protein